MRHLLRVFATLYTLPNFLFLCHPSVVDWYFLRWLELLQSGGERWLCCTIFNYVTSALAAAFLFPGFAWFGPCE